MECCGGDRNSLFCPGQFILVHLCLIVPAPEFGLFLDILRLLTKLCPSMHDTENSLEVPIIFFFWGGPLGNTAAFLHMLSFTLWTAFTTKQI